MQNTPSTSVSVTRSPLFKLPWKLRDTLDIVDMQNTSSTSVSVTRSPLFKLPRELRDKIYEYAVYSGDDGICYITREDGIPEPSLLFTCKVVREEAVEVFYNVNSVRPKVISLHPAAVVLHARKLRSLMMKGLRTKGTDAITFDYNSLEFRTLESLQGNLMLWLQYVHVGEIRITPEFPKKKTTDSDAHLKIINSMFKIARGMGRSPWDYVKAILDDIWRGLIAVAKEA